MLLVARRAEEAHQSCYLAPCRVLLLPAAARSPSAWWCMEVISTWPEPSCRSLISNSLLWWFAAGAMLVQPRTRLSRIVSRHYRWIDGWIKSKNVLNRLSVSHCAQSQVKRRNSKLGVEEFDRPGHPPGLNLIQHLWDEQEVRSCEPGSAFWNNTFRWKQHCWHFQGQEWTLKVELKISLKRP